jgi:hypothetical protein
MQPSTRLFDHGNINLSISRTSTVPIHSTPQPPLSLSVLTLLPAFHPQQKPQAPDRARFAMAVSGRTSQSIIVKQLNVTYAAEEEKGYIIQSF